MINQNKNSKKSLVFFSSIVVTIFLTTVILLSLIQARIVVPVEGQVDFGAFKILSSRAVFAPAMPIGQLNNAIQEEYYRLDIVLTQVNQQEMEFTILNLPLRSQ